MNDQEKKMWIKFVSEIHLSELGPKTVQRVLHENSGQPSDVVVRALLLEHEKLQDTETPDAASLSTVLLDYMLYRIKDGRILRVVAGGSGIDVVDCANVVKDAASGATVYYQSYTARPGFAAWSDELESTYFPATTKKNDEFEFYLGMMPPGKGTHDTPAKEYAIAYATVGVPATYKEIAEEMLKKYNLRADMEYCGVGGVFTPKFVTLLQLRDTGNTGRVVRELRETPGFYLTPLRGKNIFQVTGEGKNA